LKYLVLEDFQTKREVITAGQIVALSEGAAIRLISERKVTIADEKLRYAFDERAAIVEYEARMNRKEAERLAWCQTVCMLSFPTQWEMCERFKSQPCPKLIHKDYQQWDYSF
jgi:hypothetical protein